MEGNAQISRRRLKSHPTSSNKIYGWMLVIYEAYEANLASRPTSSIPSHICVGVVVHDEEPIVEGGLCGHT